MSIINKRGLGWVLSCLFTWSSCVCNVATAGERTAQEYLDEANVFFDVQRTDGGLRIVGKEKEMVVFNHTILDSKTECAPITSGNFNLQRLDGVLSFGYKGFNLHVNQAGGIVIPKGNQDWTQLEKVGIRTSGILENRGNYVFNSVTTFARAFHNIGALKTAHSSQFYNNYLFNSGVIQLNDGSQGFAAPRVEASPAGGVRPDFKAHVVENYGTFTSGGKLLIKDSLSYNEHNNSTFNNLEMSGGDVTLNERTSMTVKEALTGRIRNINIGENSSLEVGKIELPDVQDLRIRSQGALRSSSLNLSVNGRYLNAGEITSGANLNLYLENFPDDYTFGTTSAGGDEHYIYEGPIDVFYDAAHNGDMGVLKLLLACGVNPTMVTECGGDTALHFAAWGGHVAAIELLLEQYGADPNVKNNGGDTALHYAAREGHVDAIKLLLAHGADPNVKDPIGRTALHYVAAGGHVDAIKLLLAYYGAEPRATDNGWRTALHYATWGGHVEAMEWLLAYRADPNAADHDEKTALHYAAERSNVEAMELLLKSGADLGATDDAGRTAIHLAAERGNVEVMKLLLAYSADPNAADHDKKTALHLAAERGNVEVMKLLLEHGADPNVADNYEETALHHAALGGHLAAMEWLLEYGAAPNAANRLGDTVLHHAARRSDVDAIKWLLVHGADPRATDNGRRTALHYAAEGGHVDAMKLLLSKGADLKAKTNDGKTALHYAARGGHVDAMKLLLGRGANPNAKTNDGKTALRFATERGHSAAVAWLQKKSAY